MKKPSLSIRDIDLLQNALMIMESDYAGDLSYSEKMTKKIQKLRNKLWDIEDDKVSASANARKSGIRPNKRP